MLRPTLIAIAFLVSASPAFACAADEAELWACHLDEGEHELVSLCGVPPAEEGRHFSGLRYAFQKDGTEEFSYPPDPAQSRNNMFFSHWYVNGRYRAFVRFENGPYTYRTFFRVMSDEIDMVGRPIGAVGGVEVWKGGKRISKRECAEPSIFYAGEIKPLAACDEKNPHGKKACAEEGHEFKND